MSCAAPVHADPDNLAVAIARHFDRDQMDEAVCRETIARLIKPAPVCPRCHVSLTDPDRDRLYAGKNLICPSCGVKHSLRSGTNLNGIHCDYRDIVLVAAMCFWGAPIDSISKAAHISGATVRRLAERLTFSTPGF
jgi:transposase-like protein